MCGFAREHVTRVIDAEDVHLKGNGARVKECVCFDSSVREAWARQIAESSWLPLRLQILGRAGVDMSTLVLAQI